MIRLLALVALLVAIVGCGSKNSDSPSSPVKMKIADEDYKSLMAADQGTLIRRAQANELGVCVLMDQFWGESPVYNPPQELWALYLQDKNLYYPEMSKTPKADTLGNLGYEVKEALAEGFCYQNISGPSSAAHN